MPSRPWKVAIAAAVLTIVVRTASAAGDPTLLRVFMTDGTSLASYGEPARVGDRVIFSMPTTAGTSPALHLVNIHADRVDWDRTNRYAASARATQYVQTQAETDYAELSNEIARTLNEVALTTEPAKRLEIVQRARGLLAEWPQSHYNYRQAEARQMLAMLDEAIADLRAQTGAGRFDLALAAYADPPTVVEPLLPPPTLKDSIEQTLLAARAVDSAAERTSLLTVALLTLDREKASLPADWVDATRTTTATALQAELRVDRAYQLLTTRMVTLADRSARAADVKSLQWLLTRIERRDAAMGRKRPEAVNALVKAVEDTLDATRRLQLARGRWRLRAPVLREYRVAIGTPMELFLQVKPALEAIRALSGSTPAALTRIQRATSAILALASAIVPPDETMVAHALFVSAVQLAANAAQIRREATVAGDMPRAWDASSTAAGALMLGAKARSDMQASLRFPQLNSPW